MYLLGGALVIQGLLSYCYHIFLSSMSRTRNVQAYNEPELEMRHPVQPANVLAHTKMTPDPVLKMGRGVGDVSSKNIISKMINI